MESPDIISRLHELADALEKKLQKERKMTSFPVMPTKTKSKAADSKKKNYQNVTTLEDKKMPKNNELKKNKNQSSPKPDKVIQNTLVSQIRAPEKIPEIDFSSILPVQNIDGKSTSIRVVSPLSKSKIHNSNSGKHEKSSDTPENIFSFASSSNDEEFNELK